MLVVESHTSVDVFLGERIDPFHVGLKQVVLVFDPVFDQILELFHLDLHDNLVHVGVARPRLEDRAFIWVCSLLE